MSINCHFPACIELLVTRVTHADCVRTKWISVSVTRVSSIRANFQAIIFAHRRLHQNKLQNIATSVMRTWRCSIADVTDDTDILLASISTQRNATYIPKPHRNAPYRNTRVNGIYSYVKSYACDTQHASMPFHYVIHVQYIRCHWLFVAETCALRKNRIEFCFLAESLRFAASLRRACVALLCVTNDGNQPISLSSFLFCTRSMTVI